MQNFIDDNEAYARLLPVCSCGCVRHCGISCRSDHCDCFECGCARCRDDLALTASHHTDVHRD